MRHLHLDPIGGVAGDMLAAAGVYDGVQMAAFGKKSRLAVHVQVPA